MIEIIEQPIDTAQVLEAVASDDCGANVLFVGTTRQFTQQRETTTLAYECYQEMALKKMSELARAAQSKWDVEKVAMVHRIGIVDIGQASIAVAVSSPHRKDSFESATWLMEELKQQVPIWKQEQWADGTTEWVHPTGAATVGEKPAADPMPVSEGGSHDTVPDEEEAIG